MAEDESRLFRQNTKEELDTISRRLKSIKRMLGNIKPYGITEADYYLNVKQPDGPSDPLNLWHTELYSVWARGEGSQFQVTLAQGPNVRPHLLMTDQNGFTRPLSNKDLKVYIWHGRQVVGNSGYLVNAVGDLEDQQLSQVNQGFPPPSYCQDPRGFLRLQEDRRPGIGVTVLHLLPDLSSIRDRYDRVIIEMEEKDIVEATEVHALDYKRWEAQQGLQRRLRRQE